MQNVIKTHFRKLVNGEIGLVIKTSSAHGRALIGSIHTGRIRQFLTREGVIDIKGKHYKVSFTEGDKCKIDRLDGHTDLHCGAWQECRRGDLSPKVSHTSSRCASYGGNMVLMRPTTQLWMPKALELARSKKAEAKAK